MEDQCELALSPLLPTACYTGRKCQWGRLIHIQSWDTGLWAAESRVHAVLGRTRCWCCEVSSGHSHEETQECQQVLFMICVTFHWPSVGTQYLKFYWVVLKFLPEHMATLICLVLEALNMDTHASPSEWTQTNFFLSVLSEFYHRDITVTVWYGDLAADVDCDQQHILGQFAAECTADTNYIKVCG